jgi:hypothetical protein
MLSCYILVTYFTFLEKYGSVCIDYFKTRSQSDNIILTEQFIGQFQKNESKSSGPTLISLP